MLTLLSPLGPLPALKGRGPTLWEAHRWLPLPLPPPRTPSGYEAASTLNSPSAEAKSPCATCAPLATAPVAKRDYPS
jgi:hypothetical protein